MISMGEWKKVQFGNVIVIGYVSNIVQYSWHSERVELTMVGLFVSGKLEWKEPTNCLFEKSQLEDIGSILEQYQDKTVLIDLALLTKDKLWFKELTANCKGVK